MTTEDEAKERKKLLAETRADLLKRQLSNSEAYDKAVLTLSTAALGFSLGFLKDFIPVTVATWPWALYASWICLTTALVVTVLSLFVSQVAITEQIRRADEYYERGSDDALPRSLSARLTDWLNYTSGAFFITGIIATTLFVFLNIEGASNMRIEAPGIRNGAPVPQLQKIEKGAPIPNLQKIPASQPASPPAQPANPPPATTSK